VEDHFYILLPLFLLILTKVSRKRADPFGAIPVVFCILAPLVLMMRVVTAYQAAFEFEDAPRILFPTHMRVDALFFGVVLGYLHHFRPALIPGLLKSRRNRLLAALLTCFLLSCLLATYAESRFMLSFGLTLLYLGFGGALVLFLYTELPAAASWGHLGEKVGDALAGVGKYSYSIYLWHVPIVTHGLPALHAMSPVPLAQAVYVALSIGVGIAMARLIEIPALALRDRLFPGVSGTTAVVQVHGGEPPMAGLEQKREEEVVAGGAAGR
jgi:peptidoglycan/LPS O-acetylase OafA/YrhL